MSEAITALLVGSSGQVGRSLVELCQQRADFLLISPNRIDMDLSSVESLQAMLSIHRPQYVINAAAYTDVESAEDCPEQCFELNATAVGELARLCKQQQIPLLHLSTDYVFDGMQSLPYTEEDLPNPLSVYARSKWEGEENVRHYCSQHIILRVCGVFSPWRKNFVKTIFNAFRANKKLSVINDQQCCPTGAADIARVLLAILQQVHCGASAWGTYHYVAADVMTWHSFAEAVVREAALQLDLPLPEIAAIATSDYPTKAKRPPNSVLDCHKILHTFGIQQRSWQSDLVNVVAQLAAEAGK